MRKQNIGTINALTRITVGLFLLVFGAVKLVKRPWNQSYWMIVLMSAMKVGEGIVRYCPVTDVVQQKVNHEQSHQSESK
ncbi:YgaP family membrane protein [Piscibacillus sp. B03]|uniref:YgaP family membrane protein n=1 Tax=Piscibacillus sp. B03 TaxID=3457430 RepID=UPI003FCD04C4